MAERGLRKAGWRKRVGATRYHLYHGSPLVGACRNAGKAPVVKSTWVDIESEIVCNSCRLRWHEWRAAREAAETPLIDNVVKFPTEATR